MFLIIIIAIMGQVMGEPLYLDYQVQEDYVPILGYHKIGDETTSTYITRSDFEDQVDYLTNTFECNWITMETFATYIENGEKLPTKTCIMNFDDGSWCQYSKGLCSLNEHKVPATFYIAPDNIEYNSYYMTWENVDKLNSIGHDIQAHTLDHVHLDTLSYSEQETQILDSKTILEARGYNTIKTFAYPYGDYNDDTLDIVRENFVIGRDTSQDSGWKDIRAPVVSFNEDNSLHFYYIKPEGYSGEELANIIDYTGWWQFEDNYKVINDNDGDIGYTTSSTYLPTDNSLGLLKLYDTDDEISTQFITKYGGYFTLDILMYNSTIDIGFSITVDGNPFTPGSYDYTHPNMLYYQTDSGTEFYNFYVNIGFLEPGIHVFNVINNQNSKIYLDKFRLFSNVSQDFSDLSDMESYVECDPLTEEYCTCDSTPSPTSSPTSEDSVTSDLTCANGILSNNEKICCDSACGSCGGSGCGSRTGGGANCCQGTITSAGKYCDTNEAPCIMTDYTLSPTTSNPTNSPTPNPTNSPSSSPTPNPTNSPTPNPTNSPSSSPTKNPTNSPTPTPTSSPTVTGQTSSPTLSPTNNPTSSPTPQTSSPTYNPSSSPTSSPIYNPSSSPTSSPTGNPTSSPTQNPTVSTPSDPTCDNGILSSSEDVCCDSACGSCGGNGCGDREGGSHSCCEGTIEGDGNSCNENEAPCVMG